MDGRRRVFFSAEQSIFYFTPSAFFHAAQNFAKMFVLSQFEFYGAEVRLYVQSYGAIDISQRA